MKKKNILGSVILAIITATLLAACAPGGVKTPGAGTVTPEGELPPLAVLKAQTWLSDRLDALPQEVEIQSVEQVEWRDSCLGLGGPAESCLQVITPGWRIIFAYNGQEYEVHTDEDSNIIRMAPNPAKNEPLGQLLNTQWMLESFVSTTDKRDSTPVLAETNLTLQFETQDWAIGQGGCNEFGTKYWVMFDRISFQELITTEIACAPEIMEQEQRFYQALQTADSFELSGEQLTIQYDDEQMSLNFSQVLATE